MQTKTIIKFHLTPLRIAIIKKYTTINAGEGVEKREPSYTVGGMPTYRERFYLGQFELLLVGE